MTPVIVAAVSETLNRPAAKASALARQRRTLVLESRERQAARALGDDPNPLRGAPDFAQGAAADEELATNGNGNGGRPGTPPVTIHGRSRWRRIHPKVAIATGLAAFAIAVAVLTLPELLFGGAVATAHRTTFFGGGSTSTQKQQTKTQTDTTTQTKTAPSTVTQTVPAQQPAQTTPTDTTTTPTDTGTQTAPTPTQQAQTDTGTATAPAPPGAVP